MCCASKVINGDLFNLLQDHDFSKLWSGFNNSKFVVVRYDRLNPSMLQFSIYIYEMVNVQFHIEEKGNKVYLLY